MLLSEEYADLSAFAVKLIVDLSAQYNGRNNGDLTIAWKLMRDRGWSSKDTLYRAKRELLNTKFVVVTRQGGRRIPTLLALTFKAIDACGGKLHAKPTAAPTNIWMKNRSFSPVAVPMWPDHRANGAFFWYGYRAPLYISTKGSRKNTMSFDLRPYQQTVIQQLRREVARGHKRILLVAPTGSGKTIVASEIIRSAVEKNNRALFLAHRRELIFQCREKLFEYRVPHGLILAGEDYGAGQPVQVASIQTLHSRTKRQVMDPPPADLVVVDECHRARAWTYADLLNDYPDAIILGLTATPCRGDGRGLGRLFDAMVECPAVAELIEQQFLVPTRVFSPSIPGLEGVRVRKGDYLEGELAEVMDLPKLVGDVVTHWHRLGENRKTVVFATGVEHSIHIRDEFRRSGVWCEHIDGTTPKEERREILERLSEGKVQIVANCMVLTEGWDQPDVACVILARPTKHMGLYRQMVGRVLRPAEGKTDALVLDHAGATLEHGFCRRPGLVDAGRGRPGRESHPGCTQTTAGPGDDHLPRVQGDIQ